MEYWTCNEIIHEIIFFYYNYQKELKFYLESLACDGSVSGSSPPLGGGVRPVLVAGTDWELSPAASDELGPASSVTEKEPKNKYSKCRALYVILTNLDQWSSFA